jgi:CxxC motif-containing protein
MLEKKVVCVGCPLGCNVTLKVRSDGDIESVAGNQCKEGKKYAILEFQLPLRVFTSTVLTESDIGVLPVRTDKPVPKTKIVELMQAVADIRIKPPIGIGQVIVHDILKTGANLIATNNL